MSKNKVAIDVPRLGADEQPADTSSLTAAVEKSEVVEEASNPGKLVSRADHPLEVKYGDSIIRLSPRQRVEIADMSKIERSSLSPLITVITQ